MSDYVHVASLVAAICCFNEVKNGQCADIPLNLPIWMHIEAHGKRLAEVSINFIKAYSKSNPRNRALHSLHNTLINYHKGGGLLNWELKRWFS